MALQHDFLVNLITEEKFIDALSYLRQLIVDNASSSAVRCFGHTFRGLILEQMQDKNAAIEEFTQAITIDPESEDCYTHRANLLEEIGDLTNAIRDYNKLIELDPFNDSFYFNRAGLFKKIGWYQKSLHDLNKAIELRFDGNYLMARGSLHKYFLKNYNDALADFEWALQDASISRGSVFLQKAHTYILMENEKDATECLERSSWNSWKSPIMRNYVEGLIKQHQKNFVEAELCFMVFLKESARNGNSHQIAVLDTKQRLRKMLTRGFGVLDWTICRVIWIGHLKNSSITCSFAALPRDVVKIIIGYLKDLLYEEQFPFYL